MPRRCLPRGAGPTAPTRRARSVPGRPLPRSRPQVRRSAARRELKGPQRPLPAPRNRPGPSRLPPAHTSHPRWRAAPRDPRPGPTVTPHALPRDTPHHPSPRAARRSRGRRASPPGPTYRHSGASRLPAGSSCQASWRRGRRESGLASGARSSATGGAAPDWLAAAEGRGRARRFCSGGGGGGGTMAYVPGQPVTAVVVRRGRDGAGGAGRWGAGAGCQRVAAPLCPGGCQCRGALGLAQPGEAGGSSAGLRGQALPRGAGRSSTCSVGLLKCINCFNQRTAHARGSVARAARYHTGFNGGSGGVSVNPAVGERRPWPDRAVRGESQNGLGSRDL